MEPHIKGTCGEALKVYHESKKGVNCLADEQLLGICRVTHMKVKPEH